MRYPPARSAGGFVISHHRFPSFIPYIEYCIANDLEEAKNSEEKLFIEKINHIAEWADEIINTANERSAETNKQKNLMLK